MDMFIEQPFPYIYTIYYILYLSKWFERYAVVFRGISLLFNVRTYIDLFVRTLSDTKKNSLSLCSLSYGF